MYARGSTNAHDVSKEDELYEEMREGTPDEEIDSQEVTSVRDLPKEVLAEMEREQQVQYEDLGQQNA